MVSSLLGRLITGPLAFLLAGLYDFAAFASVFAVRSARTRVRAYRGSGSSGETN